MVLVINMKSSNTNRRDETVEKKYDKLFDFLANKIIKAVYSKKGKCTETEKCVSASEEFPDTIRKRLPTEEIINRMYDKSLCFTDEVLKVIYSKDKSKRYVILQNESGIVHFVFEEIELYDDYESNFLENSWDAPPAVWNSFNTHRSFFGTLDEAVQNLKFESEYKQYFE